MAFNINFREFFHYNLSFLETQMNISFRRHWIALCYPDGLWSSLGSSNISDLCAVSTITLFVLYIPSSNVLL